MLRSFEGNTWVAFLDISGFKQIMKNLHQAEKVLDKFYNTVYREGFRINHDFPFETYTTGKSAINSVVVSDCAIIFVDNQSLAEDKVRDLHLILDVIKSINLALIDPDQEPQIMTTCAIDYGHFKYSNRSSDIHTSKSFFYGQTYVKAYLGCEELSKMPGFCRVLNADFTIPAHLQTSSPFKLLKQNNERYDFYWMLNSAENLELFKSTYDGLSQSLYAQIASLLLRATQNEDFEK
jgi:hypothetical protein